MGGQRIERLLEELLGEPGLTDIPRDAEHRLLALIVDEPGVDSHGQGLSSRGDVQGFDPHLAPLFQVGDPSGDQFRRNGRIEIGHPHGKQRLAVVTQLLPRRPVDRKKAALQVVDEDGVLRLFKKRLIEGTIFHSSPL